MGSQVTLNDKMCGRGTMASQQSHCNAILPTYLLHFAEQRAWNAYAYGS